MLKRWRYDFRIKILKRLTGSACGLQTVRASCWKAFKRRWWRLRFCISSVFCALHRFLLKINLAETSRFANQACKNQKTGKINIFAVTAPSASKFVGFCLVTSYRPSSITRELKALDSEHHWRFHIEPTKQGLRKRQLLFEI